MTSLLLAASLRSGHVTIDLEHDARTEAEPAVSIVDARWLDVTALAVTMVERRVLVGRVFGRHGLE